MIQISEKSKNVLQKSIIFIVIGLCISLFLSKTTSLQTNQIGIFLGLSGATIAATRINHRIKYILIIPCIFCLGLLLLIGTFPLFEKSPDKEAFKQTKTIQYSMKSKITGDQIIVENNQISKTILIKETSQKIYLGDYTKIQLKIIAKYPDIKNILYIQYPDNSTIAIENGSEIQIETDTKNWTITKIKGNIEYYLADTNKNITIQNTENKDKKNKETFIGQGLIKAYENEEKKYLLNHIGGTIMNHEIIRKINKIILDIAYKIRPNIYKQHEENYIQYTKIFERKDTTSKTYENINSKIQDHMISESQRGIKETMFFKNIFGQN